MSNNYPTLQVQIKVQVPKARYLPSFFRPDMTHMEVVAIFAGNHTFTLEYGTQDNKPNDKIILTSYHPSINR